ncbi:hypothetical protein FGG08_003301 [Glutinoglossum americanum]|uniref:Uracil catabolism protein 4 n=1 Tax=Glutinoglossum americanum TaxID=1670608 RepID=A0A9P8I9Y5_9PEZI|nr:hypothetical protein FGG08_003301 [Glutinoglossum americanum]
MGIFSKKTSKSSNADTTSLRSTNSRKESSASSVKSPLSNQLPNSNGSFSLNTAVIPETSLPKPPDPSLDPAAYLRSIYAVRERCRIVMQKAKENRLTHFTVDPEKFDDTAKFVVSIIKRDYAPEYSSIPPHGRWQHFDVGGRPRINQLMASWGSAVDAQERARRLIDLFLVSVLLDAGAGTKWQYKSKETGRIYRRSEGLAVASLEMFKAGVFSSDSTEPCQVDGAGLKRLTVEVLAKGLQVTEHNPLTGLDGRAGLLIRLGDALNNQELFGVDARPGNMLDYLLSHSTTRANSVPIVTIPTLWSVVMDGLSSIWPASRTQVDGMPLGDAWPCSSMPASPPAEPWESIVPFHKLTQWLTYSLMAPMTKLLNIHFAGVELLTGLPEYRNGGLLIDIGLLTLKPADARRGLDAYHANAKSTGQDAMEVVPLFMPDDDVVVEWRAVTIGFLDALLVRVNDMLGLAGNERLSLAQMLEAGTWKGGRELAEVSRPNTKQPPIMILSDGTIF